MPTQMVLQFMSLKMGGAHPLARLCLCSSTSAPRTQRAMLSISSIRSRATWCWWVIWFTQHTNHSHAQHPRCTTPKWDIQGCARGALSRPHALSWVWHAINRALLHDMSVWQLQSEHWQWRHAAKPAHLAHAYTPCLPPQLLHPYSLHAHWPPHRTPAPAQCPQSAPTGGTGGAALHATCVPCAPTPLMCHVPMPLPRAVCPCPSHFIVHRRTWSLGSHFSWVYVACTWPGRSCDDNQPPCALCACCGQAPWAMTTTTMTGALRLKLMCKDEVNTWCAQWQWWQWSPQQWLVFEVWM